MVIAQAGVALGASMASHDLSALGSERLRSHGGTTEARVPFILSEALNPAYQARAAQGLHSHQIFEFAINGTRTH